MKGLTYCWFVSCKGYFIAAVIALIAGVALILGVLPNLDFLDASLRNLLVFILGMMAMAIPAESLGRHLERYIKTSFADYMLSAMDKRSFVNSLVLREVICFGFSLVAGYAVLFSFIISEDIPVTAELMMLAPFFALMANGIDLIAMPLTVKLKSAEKAGLIVGAIAGVLIMYYAITVNVIRDGGFEEILVTMDFGIPVMLIVMGIMLAACVIAYLITLKLVKRGDVC